MGDRLQLPVSARSFNLREFQASQTMPISAQSRSRLRRVNASARPSNGESPVNAKAEIAPPSSEPRRAGIQPLIIFNARVTPSMARTAPKWTGRRSDSKTTTTSAASNT